MGDVDLLQRINKGRNKKNKKLRTVVSFGIPCSYEKETPIKIGAVLSEARHEIIITQLGRIKAHLRYMDDKLQLSKWRRKIVEKLERIKNSQAAAKQKEKVAMVCMRV